MHSNINGAKHFFPSFPLGGPSGEIGVSTKICVCSGFVVSNASRLIFHQCKLTLLVGRRRLSGAVRSSRDSLATKQHTNDESLHIITF